MDSPRRYAMVAATCVPLGLLLVLLATTDPQRLPSALLVLPFGFVFAAVFSLALGIIAFLRREEGTVLGLPLRRPRVLATVLAAFPTLLLVLQSIGQLSVWDVTTASVLLVMSYIYVTRSSVSFFR